MMMFLKADSCFWYTVPFGFVVLTKSLILVENLNACKPRWEVWVWGWGATSWYRFSAKYR